MEIKFVTSDFCKDDYTAAAVLAELLKHESSGYDHIVVVQYIKDKSKGGSMRHSVIVALSDPSCDGDD